MESQLVYGLGGLAFLGSIWLMWLWDRGRQYDAEMKLATSLMPTKRHKTHLAIEGVSGWACGSKSKSKRGRGAFNPSLVTCLKCRALMRQPPSRPTASDSLWLAILKDNADLVGKNPREVRAILREQGVPEHIIDVHLNRKQP